MVTQEKAVAVVTATTTSKGQVTIPKAVREDLGIKPGDKIDFVLENGGYRVKRHFDQAKFDAAIEKWAGRLKLPKGKTVDDLINEMRGD